MERATLFTSVSHTVFDPDFRKDARYHYVVPQGVVGNQVLQFLPDRAGALEDMQRVMTRDGRAIFGVYCGLDLCPAHGAVAKALEQHEPTEGREGAYRGMHLQPLVLR